MERIEREFEYSDRQAERIKLERVARRELTNRGWSTRRDEVGRFEIADMPPGDYRLEVHLPGFASVEEHVTVEAGQRLKRQIALEVGSLEEKRPRIGDGPLQPPIKLRSLMPAYPDALRTSGAQGTVMLEALVAADGSFRVTPVDPDLLTPVQPELARAAVDAARQWQFEPTRLHAPFSRLARRTACQETALDFLSTRPSRLTFAPQLIEPLVAAAPVPVELVPDRVLHVVVLVVVFCRPELTGLDDLCHDRLVKAT